MKKEINNNYTNDQIFDIFKTSKKLLYFLFKEKIIISDKHIFNIMNDYKNSLKNYPQFFYPEFKLFFTDELIKEYKINEMNFIEFEEKREIGENDDYIYQLIRDDLIDEFIVYITKNNISLNSKIHSSIFETNEFLIDKTPTFLEYATFFGSIQIFQFIKLNSFELTSSLWLYAIHGKNPDIIHLLEENGVIPNSYKECLLESIKCHHNEIKEYFQTNYRNEINDSDIDILKQSIKSYNCIGLSEKFIKRSDVFYYLCKYDHVELVQLIIENNKIDINWQRKKQRFKKDGFEKMFTNYQKHNIEKKCEDSKTPLIAAIENRNKEIIEILLKQKTIDINVKYESSYNFYSDGEKTDYLGEESKSILFLAAEKDYAEIVQILINRNDINVNEISEIYGPIGQSYAYMTKKLTALHIAVENENFESIKVLLSAININANCIEYDAIPLRGIKEKTPLIIAIEKENSNIVQLLLSKSETNPNQIYYYYDHKVPCEGSSYDELYSILTPLQLAIEKENKEIIQILLDTKKIIINDNGFKTSSSNRGRFINKTSEAALLMAVEKNNFDITQMLLSYDGINVNSSAIYNQRDNVNIILFEKTPLYIAIENENIKIIELLLNNYKINKNIELYTTKRKFGDEKNTYEKTNALELATKKGNSSIINILKKRDN